MKKVTDIALIVVVVLLMLTAVLVYLGPRMGYRADNIISGSMEPTLSVNTMVVAHTLDPKAVQVGDIIAFKPVICNKNVCHRVTAVLNTTPVGFKTQGDADKITGKPVDPWVVPAANVLGRVDFSAPVVGIFIQFLGTKVGLLVGLIIPALILFWLIFRILWRDLVRYIRNNSPKEG